MLEGKTPFDPSALASVSPSMNSSPSSANSIQGSSHAIQEKIVYK